MEGSRHELVFIANKKVSDIKRDNIDRFNVSGPSTSVIKPKLGQVNNHSQVSGT